MKVTSKNQKRIKNPNTRASHPRDTSKGNVFEESFNPHVYLEGLGYKLQKSTGEYYLNGVATGLISARKGECASFLKKTFDVDLIDIMGKNRQPDFAFFNKKTGKLFIGETKNQKTSGSADEKVLMMEKLADRYRELGCLIAQKGHFINVEFAVILQKSFFENNKVFKHVYEEWDSFNDMRYFFMDDHGSGKVKILEWLGHVLQTYEVTDAIMEGRKQKWAVLEKLAQEKKKAVSFSD